MLFALLLFLTQVNSYPTFEEFTKVWEKTYENAEYEEREHIYNTRIEQYANIKEYEPGINQMSDWNNEEISIFTNLKTFTTQKLEEIEIKMGKEIISNNLRVTNPSKLDWREKNAVTSVKNQGSCGSCWAFAAVAYAESKIILTNPRYTIENTDFSEQYLLECTKESDCSGGYVEYAMEKSLELPSEQEYPYTPYNSQSGICSTVGTKTGSSSISWYFLSDDQLVTLLQSGPLAIALSATGWYKYGNGVFQCEKNSPINHAVLLVGYTEEYWIIKNQWGHSWGEKGYIRITRDENLNCRIGRAVHFMHETALKVLFFTLLLIFTF